MKARIRSGRPPQAPYSAASAASSANCGRLALGEAGDRHLHLLGIQAQLRHHGARRLDFLLRHAPVGLGDMPHDLECGAEEALADLSRRGARRAAHARAPGDAGVGTGIELMTEHDADGRTDRAAGKEADESADCFPDPLHTLIY